MDKTAIKTFAVESRRKLMEDVEYRMSLLGITENEIKDSISDVDGVEAYDYGASTPHKIYDEDIKKRQNLVKEVNNKGFENVVEEVAYTWFNRIIAIRFMEVNNYLPTRTRVLSSETLGKTEPDMVTEALDLDLDYTQEDKELIFKLKDENQEDELFRFLFIKQCNKLNEILPGLFEKTEDYMELLLNISFTSEDSVVRQLVNKISEEDFKEQVEIIGWLYQFYNTELKDDTFANLKKKVKISKERIPAATQLFTPDWIVKYMVENSVGRLWLEGHPNENLKSQWKYYVEDAEQEPSVEQELIKIKKDSEILRPEDIKVIDPCMGSGHILVYVFDVLMQIYVSEGYTEKDATISILENNLYGLDIDDRAYQLAYFAVMMKARKYNRRVLRGDIKPLLASVKESNSLSSGFIDYLLSIDDSIVDDLNYLIDLFIDSKDYGCILDVKEIDFGKLSEILLEINSNKTNLVNFNYADDLKKLESIINQAKFLSQKYDVVVTNPPYMGNSGMNSNLKNYIKNNFPLSKTDLFAVFIEKGLDMIKKNGINCMVTMQSWMFLSSFEKFRKKIMEETTLINLMHMDNMVMRIAFGTSVTILRNINLNSFNGTYYKVKLSDLDNDILNPNFFSNENCINTNQTNFDKIPGSPIAYWADKHVFAAFENGNFLEEYADIKVGLQTGENNRFLRYWFEVNHNKIGFNFENCDAAKNSNLKWFPYNKGGKYKKWYGNQDYVINWQNDGYEVKNFEKAVIRNSNFYFKKGLTWSTISSGNVSFRYSGNGFLFDTKGSKCFIHNYNYEEYLFSFLNSNIVMKFLSFLAPTLDFSVGSIGKLPLIFDKNNNQIKIYVRENIEICKNDWDDYETSWDFNVHPLLRFKSNNIEESFNMWSEYKLNDFNTLKSNEIELNKIFSEIYSIDVDCNVEDKHISVNLADYETDIKSFISYAVGCMFGRYSLDDDGLQFAGGEFNLNNYHKFVPDDDNIIPVLDTEYFEDDIVGYFVNFVKTSFGEESLEENLEFIGNALSKSNKTSRDKIREYLLKNFFKDHLKSYQKRPIYWMFNSGKQNGFNCLVYMHRYTPDLVARVRTDYLHKTQKAIEQNIARCDNILNTTSSATEKKKVTKERNKLEKQLQETREYDEALAHIANQNIEIDLDDGVKVNYAKFQGVEVSKEGQKTKKINLLKKI